MTYMQQTTGFGNDGKKPSPKFLRSKHHRSSMDRNGPFAQIVEHVSIVESGMVRICAKLLRKAEAEGRRSDGTVNVSDNFMEKSAEIATIKFEAPEIVHPTGEKTIADSITKMEESRTAREELRPAFESFDGNAHKFSHPFFGDLSAVEWLILIGGHEARHLNQIKGIRDRIQK